MIHTLLTTIKPILRQDNKSLTERSSKLFEEGGELAGAINVLSKISGTGYKQATMSEIKALEECVDVILVAASIIHELNVNENDINHAFHRKMRKWEACTSS